MTELKQQFHQAMLGIYERARDECGHTATRFLDMLAKNGRLGTVQILLATSRYAPDRAPRTQIGGLTRFQLAF